jgi:predicted NAD-dependent protein-ADP-ribosyltransferase YbiA (DUF1768 family)
MLSVFCKFRRNNLQRTTTREQLQAAFLFSTWHPSGRDSKWAEWPEPKKHRTQYTPVQNATGVGLATGNDTSTRWKQGLWIK